MDRMKLYETNQEFLDRLYEEDLERKHYEEQERRYREQLELRQYQERLLSRHDWEYIGTDSNNRERHSDTTILFPVQSIGYNIPVVNIKYKGKGRNYLHERI